MSDELTRANLEDAIAAAEARVPFDPSPWEGEARGCLTVARTSADVHENGWPGDVVPQETYRGTYQPVYYTYSLAQCRTLLSIIHTTIEEDQQ